MSHAEQTTALAALLHRVQTAIEPDRWIDTGLWRVLIEKPRPGDKIDRDMIGRWPEYTGSVDAALGLLKHVLPRHGYRIQRGAPGMKPVATLFAPIELPDAPIDDGRSWARPTDGTGATDALALISALLSAKLALLTQEEGR